MPIDDRTSTQNYPKPNIANTLADDVGRLRTALDDIDTDIDALAPKASPVFTGTAAIPAGSDSAPSLYFTGDPNTGLYSPGADQVALATGGTGRLFVSSAGNVGIATSNIGTVLDVEGAIRSKSGTIDARLQAGYSGAVGIGAVSNDPVLFIQNSTERMRLDSSGRLGLGTSSPGAGLHLTSAGQTTAALNTAGDLNAIISDSGSGVGNGGSLVFAAANGAWRFASIKGLATDGGNNTRGHLTFSTRNASTDSTLTERLIITDAGLVGIGTTSPGTALDVNGTIRAATGQIDLENASQFKVLGYYHSAVRKANVAYDNTNNWIYLASEAAGSQLLLGTAGVERARIDSSGRLLVGASASITAVTFPSLIQSNAFYAYQASLFSADASGPNTFFLKSRNATTGSHTVVQANDVFGQIQFAGSDGTNFVSGAAIAAAVDGTPGANDMPGRLVFSTTADGASSTTERLRITSAGVLQVADAGNISVGTTTGTKIGTATTQKLGFFDKTPVVQPAAVADATDAASVITQLNALLARMRDLGLIAT